MITLDEAVAKIAILRGDPPQAILGRHNNQFRLTATRYMDPGEHFGKWVLILEVVHNGDLPTGAPLGGEPNTEWRESPFIVESVDEIPRKLAAAMHALSEWLLCEAR
jgi:hypothetical protein